MVWLPSDGDYTLVALPLLAGGTRGAALGVDGDLVAPSRPSVASRALLIGSSPIPCRYHVPRKIRELVADLVRAGFVSRGGKGSHRNLIHPTGARITLAGGPGSDAKPYQERDVNRVLEPLRRKR